jgi:hypothetical protein
VLSVEEVLASQTLVYPVPASDVISFELTEPLQIQLKGIKVMDLFGRTVNYSLSGNQIGVGQLSPGIYLIEFDLGDARFFKRFVKE